MDIAIGLLIIAIGAFCQSSSYVPINKIKDWNWESYWLVQGVFAWLAFPLLGALLAVPAGESLPNLFAHAKMLDIGMTILFGMLWGVGGLTFGLSMRYLGVALGQSISLGTCAGLGTILAPVMLNLFYPEAHHLEKLTASVLIGVAAALVGIAIIGMAGNMKAQSLSEEEKKAAVRDFNFPKGIVIALLAGFMSGCFNVGLEFGSSIHFDIGRLRDQRRLLPIPEREERHVGRLPQRQRMDEQPRVLRLGGRALVQPVLRAGTGERLLGRIARPDNLRVLHPHGAQCRVLQRVGHHPEGMERMFAENHHGAGHRPGGTHRVVFPAPTVGIGAIPGLLPRGG